MPCIIDKEARYQDDNAGYGYYVPVWEKQPGGTWKFVFDAGNQGPILAGFASFR